MAMARSCLIRLQLEADELQANTGGMEGCPPLRGISTLTASADLPEGSASPCARSSAHPLQGSSWRGDADADRTPLVDSLVATAADALLAACLIQDGASLPAAEEVSQRARAFGGEVSKLCSRHSPPLGSVDVLAMQARCAAQLAGIAVEVARNRGAAGTGDAGASCAWGPPQRSVAGSAARPSAALCVAAVAVPPGAPRIGARVPRIAAEGCRAGPAPWDSSARSTAASTAEVATAAVALRHGPGGTRALAEAAPPSASWTQRAHLFYLRLQNPQRTVVIHGIRLLGPGAANLIRSHFQRFGGVDEVLLTHAAQQTHWSEPGFVLMSTALGASRALGCPCYNVGGAIVEVAPLKHGSGADATRCVQ